MSIVSYPINPNCPLISFDYRFLKEPSLENIPGSRDSGTSSSSRLCALRQLPFDVVQWCSLARPTMKYSNLCALFPADDILRSEGGVMSFREAKLVPVLHKTALSDFHTHKKKVRPKALSEKRNGPGKVHPFRREREKEGGFE